MKIGSILLALGITCGALAGAVQRPSAAEAEKKASGTARQPALETPWPAVLPCSPVRWLRFGAVEDAFTWSGHDGSPSVSFAKDRANAWLQLDRAVAADKLDRLSASFIATAAPAEAPMERAVSVACSRGISDGSAVHWGPCAADGACDVTASYPIATVAEPSRAKAWVARTRVADKAMTQARYSSQFLTQIAWHGQNVAKLRGPATQLARDIVTDLRDFLAVACEHGRCVAPVQRLTDTGLGAFLKAKPTYEHLDDEIDNFSHIYAWKVSGDQTSVEIVCRDVFDMNETVCTADIALGGSSVLHYIATNDIRVKVDVPRGSISINQKERVVSISGSVLALREAP